MSVAGTGTPADVLARQWLQAMHDDARENSTTKVRTRALLALLAERDRLADEHAAAHAALGYLFAAYLPAEECEGPRDCAGTSRGCRHCVPDARIDEARRLAQAEPALPAAVLRQQAEESAASGAPDGETEA